MPAPGKVGSTSSGVNSAKFDRQNPSYESIKTMTVQALKSPNFGFLDPSIAEPAIRAERYVFDDPNASLTKLRLFAELIARHAAAFNGIETEGGDFCQTMQKLKEKRVVPGEVRELFFMLRLWGNDAAHENKGDRLTALRALINAHVIASWFHRTFYEVDFRPARFRPPLKPAVADSVLKEEINLLQKQAACDQQELEASQGRIKELELVIQEIELKTAQYENSVKNIAERESLDPRQEDDQIRRRLNESRKKSPSELNSYAERARRAAKALGLRGDTAQKLPITQLRIESLCTSKCHGASRILAQTTSGGFIKGYCTVCGESETVTEAECKALDLWIDCPNCHDRMKSSKVGPNYGFKCTKCGCEYWLASLLPHESDLRYPENEMLSQ